MEIKHSTHFNPLRKHLSSGKIAIGAGVYFSRTIGIAQLMRTCGYDWLFVDLEHSALSIETASELTMASVSAGIPALVRVSAGAYSAATRLLDYGAWGVVLPHIETADDARDAVNHLKFPPMGARSAGHSCPQLKFEATHLTDIMETMNEQIIIVAMIESATAVANASEIIAVPGIDALLVGASDLSIAMGIPGQRMHPSLRVACQQVVQACISRSKWSGIAGIYTEELLRAYIPLGMNIILGGTDLSFLTESAKQQAQMICGIVGEHRP